MTAYDPKRPVESRMLSSIFAHEPLIRQQILTSEDTEPFYGVMIEDCFVHGWCFENQALVVECLFSLHPGNPNYEKPSSEDWACYKAGKLILRNPQFIGKLVAMEDVRKTVDPDGSIDFGSLDSADIDDGQLTLYGPFGAAKVALEDLQFVLASA